MAFDNLMICPDLFETYRKQSVHRASLAPEHVGKRFEE
jgi:hypothetical protein